MAGAPLLAMVIAVPPAATDLHLDFAEALQRLAASPPHAAAETRGLALGNARKCFVAALDPGGCERRLRLGDGAAPPEPWDCNPDLADGDRAAAHWIWRGESRGWLLDTGPGGEAVFAGR